MTDHPMVRALSDDHHCLWSPVEDLPGGSTVYECITCRREVVDCLDGTWVPVGEEP